MRSKVCVFSLLTLLYCVCLEPKSNGNENIIINYQSALIIHDSLKHELNPKYSPLDLYGDHYVTIMKKEIYLINLTNGEKTQITNNGESKGAVVLSDQYVAWVERNHVFIYNRQTRQTRRITGESAYAMQIVLDGSWIVWTDKRNERESHYDSDIYAYDLEMNTEYAIAIEPGAQTNPDIHGNLIVWQDNRYSLYRGKVKEGCGNCPENRFDIYLFDLNTGTSRIIVENRWLKSRPTVYGKRIVWEQYQERGAANCYWNQADLYMLELTSGKKYRLTKTPDPEAQPILIQNKLLWTVGMDYDVILRGTDGKEVRFETGVYVFNLDTGVLQKLTNFKEPSALFHREGAIIVEGGFGPIIRIYSVVIE